MDFEDEDDKPRVRPPEDSIAYRCLLAREHGKLTRWIVNGAAGLSRGHYGRIEDFTRGYREFKVETIRQIVDGFARLGVHVSYEWLITGQGKGPTRLKTKARWNQRAFQAQQAKQSEHYRELRAKRLRKTRKKKEDAGATE